MEKTCSRLEDIANATRESLLVKNVYQDEFGLRYDVTHPNATIEKGGVDDPLNAKGKGTGILFDTANGGSAIDIYGIPSVSDSGRNAIYTLNQYSPSKQYDCFAQ